ncbi:MAG: cytochrome c oxidase assembly protein [Pseudohongiella sp.]|nr:MAG: cytochrome c oxidase assembly protein [Pseudohongiella sp.]
MELAKKRKTLLMAFLAFDVLVVVALILLFQMRAERQSAVELREIGVTVYPEARVLSDFRLLDQQGEFFSNADFQGHWNLVFFGFTNCPDICPLTMAELAQFYAGLDFREDVKPRIFLVTVDPGQDTPESMAAYLANYNEEFIGLSGDPEQIEQLADELYVGYGDAVAASVMSASHDEHSGSHAEVELGAGDYLIEHSAHIAVIDPRGDYYAVMRAPHRDRDLLEAFRQIVR